MKDVKYVIDEYNLNTWINPRSLYGLRLIQLQVKNQILIIEKYN